MAGGDPVGTIFVELDLDSSRYLKGQQKLLKDATSTCLNIEQNFRNLGVKSSAEMDLMRAKITNSYEMIANSAKATQNDRIRAEQAMNAKLQALNEQQYGKQISMMDKLKSNWLAASAVIGAASVAVYKVTDALMAAAKTSIEMERLRVAMESALGSSGAMSSAMGFIRSESDRLGLSFQDQTKAYTKLAAAAKGTNLEGQKTRDIFSAIAEASTALQLSTDETSGALYAISQMISKGKVSSEELRQQLGERLPGAFNLAAKAMGVTAAELDEMLKKGEVYAGDFLPRFAAAIRENYAGAIEKASNSTSANIARMQTALFDLKVSIGDTFGNETAALIRGLTGLLRDMESAVYRVQGAIEKMVAYYDKIPDWIKAAAKLGEKAFMGSPFKSASYPSMADEAKALGIASGQTQQAHLESLAAARTSGASFGSGTSKAAKGISDVERAAKRAGEEMQRCTDQANRFIEKTHDEVELGSLTGLRKELRANEIEYENTIKLYENLKGAKKSAAIDAALELKNMKDRQAVLKETDTQRGNAVKAAKEQAQYENDMIELAKEHAIKHGTFFAGMSEGWAEYNKKAITAFTAGRDAVISMANSMSTAMSTMFFDVVTGKFEDLQSAFQAFGQSIIKIFTDMLAQMVVKSMMLEATGAVSWLSGLFGLSGSAASAGGSSYSGMTGAFTSLTGMFGSANGNVFSGGSLTPYANGGVVTMPTIFPMARGMGLMGEAGPEAVMPLKRLGNGRLGVSAEGGESGVTNINISIHAIDSKSLDETLSRNPSSLIKPITKALERNQMNKKWKGLLK